MKRWACLVCKMPGARGPHFPASCSSRVRSGHASTVFSGGEASVVAVSPLTSEAAGLSATPVFPVGGAE